mmetsp:Transcript_3115/g.12816  ORF Transcript_3115/g.12816 Transcript_3115/m.12816 type:complete len:218 (+) Transcript_3115:3307-3960(+)
MAVANSSKSTSMPRRGSSVRGGLMAGSSPGNSMASVAPMLISICWRCAVSDSGMDSSALRCCEVSLSRVDVKSSSNVPRPPMNMPWYHALKRASCAMACSRRSGDMESMPPIGLVGDGASPVSNSLAPSSCTAWRWRPMSRGGNASHRTAKMREFTSTPVWQMDGSLSRRSTRAAARKRPQSSPPSSPISRRNLSKRPELTWASSGSGTTASRYSFR